VWDYLADHRLSLFPFPPHRRISNFKVVQLTHQSPPVAATVLLFVTVGQLNAKFSLLSSVIFAVFFGAVM